MALYEIDGVDTADMDRGELLNVAMGLLGQRDALAEALREAMRYFDQVIAETGYQSEGERIIHEKARAALKQLEEE